MEMLHVDQINSVREYILRKKRQDKTRKDKARQGKARRRNTTQHSTAQHKSTTRQAFAFELDLEWGWG